MKSYPFTIIKENTMKKEQVLDRLIEYFISENKEIKFKDIPYDYTKKRNLLRALMNIRESQPIDSDIPKLQDELLEEESKEKTKVYPCKLSTSNEAFN